MNKFIMLRCFFRVTSKILLDLGEDFTFATLGDWCVLFRRYFGHFRIISCWPPSLFWVFGTYFS